MSRQHGINRGDNLLSFTGHLIVDNWLTSEVELHDYRKMTGQQQVLADAKKTQSLVSVSRLTLEQITRAFEKSANDFKYPFTILRTTDPLNQPIFVIRPRTAS